MSCKEASPWAVRCVARQVLANALESCQIRFLAANGPAYPWAVMAVATLLVHACHLLAAHPEPLKLVPPPPDGKQ